MMHKGNHIELRTEHRLFMCCFRSIPGVGTVGDLAAAPRADGSRGRSASTIVHLTGAPSTDKSKKSNFATSKVKKNPIYPLTFYLWVYMPWTPSFDLPTPNFAGSSNMNSVPVPGPERGVKRFRCFRNGRG